MRRRAFLRRMAFAALACGFLDLEWLAPRIESSVDFVPTTSDPVDAELAALMKELFDEVVLPQVDFEAEVMARFFERTPPPVEGRRFVFRTDSTVPGTVTRSPRA